MRDVGRASYEAMKEAQAMVKPGAKLLDVAEAVEKHITEKGFDLAFPLNISINAQAAHYTPSLADEKTFGERDVVKIDCGAAKNGILGDNALTVDLSGNYGKLVEAADAALNDAVSMIRHGMPVRSIGKAIAGAITTSGFKPIENLGGHGVGSHNLHADVFIPNYDNGDDTILTEGMVVAIEPFATTGKGYVVDSDVREIYGFVESTQMRSADARELVDELETKYPSEPFAVRWLSNRVNSKFRLYAAMLELSRHGVVESYPTLVEAGSGIVSQSEVEVLVQKDGCEILTKA